MNANEFIQKWKIDDTDKMEPFELSLIENLKIQDSTKEFLKIGLPDEAAPFFSFGPSSGALLQTPTSEYSLDNEYKIYIIIGFNGFGDPICINITNENIVYLNHDDDFGYVFLNSSLSQFLSFLLLIKNAISDLNNNLIKNKKLYKKELLKSLKAIDSQALKLGSWNDEVDSIFE